MRALLACFAGFVAALAAEPAPIPVRRAVTRPYFDRAPESNEPAATPPCEGEHLQPVGVATSGAKAEEEPPRLLLVVDDLGTPLVGVEVRWLVGASCHGGFTRYRQIGSDLTGAGGAVAIHPGATRVSVGPSGWWPRKIAPDGRLVLPRPCTIRGRVLLDCGSVAPGATVAVSSLGELQADALGCFEAMMAIEGPESCAPPLVGETWIEASLPACGSQRPMRAQVRLPDEMLCPGGSVEVELRLREVPLVEVEILLHDVPRWLSVRGAEDRILVNGCVLLRLEPGSYELRWTDEEGRDLFMAEVEVPEDCARIHLDVSPPPPEPEADGESVGAEGDDGAE